MTWEEEFSQLLVTLGLDPRVHEHSRSPVVMDGPVKPGHDG